MTAPLSVQTSDNTLARHIWDLKYRLRNSDGQPLDATPGDTWKRVARAAATVETDQTLWAERFHAIMADGRFLPAGRILAGAGSGRDVTLFNCFVMGRIPDDMAGIFDHLKEAALTMQQGGGIGYDFSTLRPRGAVVAGIGADASGPLSFMDVWDAMCRTIMSAGRRRGAMMATLSADHPDIEAFIQAKREAGRLRMFNLSVLAGDDFLDAVRADRAWPLRFGGRTWRTVRARALWDSIMQATYDYAEPGVIFIDRVNHLNRLGYCESIRATNPCGEQPLPPYGACLLGSINLAQLVDAPFTPRARLDHERLADAVTTAVRLLDDIIDVSRFPLPAQAAEAHAKRRMGLGVTGLASALVLCGQAYDSEAGRALADDWLAQLSRAAYLASADLAAEKGSFPLFDRDAHLARLEEQGVASDVREAVAAKGLRNGLLTSIAPTGTISLLAGNVSSGIEPVFSRSYRRRILESPGQARETVVEDFAWRLWRQTRTAAQPADPPGLVTAEDIAPADHVRMQAVAQRHIDSSISKTINVPRTMSFAAFKDVYLLAHELGCKGCTTYRPNDITGAVLTASPVDQDDADDPHAVPPPGTPPPIPPVATAVCPRCGEAAIQHLESCAVCAQCGFSACA